MRKFKVEDKEKKVTPQQVEQHKDFDNLITNYRQVLDNVHKKPLYKSKKGFLFILLVILVMTVIIISQREKDVAKEEIEVVE